MAPQGGIYKSWGGIQSIWGIGEEWTPSGGINKYPLIAQDVLLAGVLWRLHQWLLMLHYDLMAVAHYDRTPTQTKMDTGPMKDNIFGSEAFILLTKMEMHAFFTGTMNFKISFKIWLLMHMMPYTRKVPWPSSATARGLGAGPV